MPCTPHDQFPVRSFSFLQVMGDSRQEFRVPAAPCCSGGSAIRVAPLRIIVPPSEYCPFSTDLTLPITPLSLPTPVSSSCFAFSDTASQCVSMESVPPTPAPVLLSYSRDAAFTDLASPTSSQFLLMPPTCSETSIFVSPLVAPAATSEPVRGGYNGSKHANLCPLEVSTSTWLSDLGGLTETDRIFRRNLPEVVSTDAESSPASTPALSPSAASPSSKVSSLLACSLPSSLVRSPASLSPGPYTMSYLSPSPTRLALKPTGTDIFPSALDSLQAWREGVTPGIPRSEEPCSPLVEDIHDSRTEELQSETAVYPSVPSHRPPRVPRSQAFVKRAKWLGGHVKRLVTRQNTDKHRSSMDRDVSFRVVTSQDSENGSVILITAPPPPNDVRGPIGQEHARSRTISEYSSVVQASAGEVATMIESGSRRSGENKNTLRRLSLAALSTLKKF